MNDKKYELTDETTEMNGRTLHRIRALKTFTNEYHDFTVNKGELGGFVESKDNLSQDGTAWISGNAMAFEGSRVEGEAYIGDNAMVCGTAFIENQAIVYGTACVGGNCTVFGQAQVGGQVELNGFVDVFGSANIIYYGGDGGYPLLCIGGIRCICGHACIKSKKNLLSLPELGLSAWETEKFGENCIEIVCDKTGYTYTIAEFKENPKFQERFGDLMKPITDLIESYFKKAIEFASVMEMLWSDSTDVFRQAMVRTAIKESKLTVKQIAEKSGVKQGTINSWLYTTREPRSQNYQKVMAVLNDSKGETNND